jgi:hypothetical protein
LIELCVHVQEFFPVGGEGPESFFSAFSDEVLQAAFNVRTHPTRQITVLLQRLIAMDSFRLMNDFARALLCL